jgi:hypothetical protein
VKSHRRRKEAGPEGRARGGHSAATRGGSGGGAGGRALASEEPAAATGHEPEGGGGTRRCARPKEARLRGGFEGEGAGSGSDEGRAAGGGAASRGRSVLKDATQDGALRGQGGHVLPATGTAPPARPARRARLGHCLVAGSSVEGAAQNSAGDMGDMGGGSDAAEQHDARREPETGAGAAGAGVAGLAHQVGDGEQDASGERDEELEQATSLCGARGLACCCLVSSCVCVSLGLGASCLLQVSSLAFRGALRAGAFWLCCHVPGAL